MENKQTAVESFINGLEKLGYLNSKDYGQSPRVLKLIEQAKQMEKEQIIDAFGTGCHHESKRLVGYHDIAEQYYNETYETTQKLAAN